VNARLNQRSETAAQSEAGRQSGEDRRLLASAAIKQRLNG
jgi:hypothetical protein